MSVTETDKTTITKQHLAAAVAGATGLTQSEANIAINELLEAVCEELERKRTIELRGFGTFAVRERAARVARNPQTGEPIQLKRRFVPVVKFSKEIKSLVNSAKTDGAKKEKS